jgi:hypothetical protein
LYFKDLEAEVSVNGEQQQEEIHNGHDAPDEHQPGSWPILTPEQIETYSDFYGEINRQLALWALEAAQGDPNDPWLPPHITQFLDHFYSFEHHGW